MESQIQPVSENTYSIYDLYFELLDSERTLHPQILVSRRGAILQDIEPLRKYGELEAIQWRKFEKNSRGRPEVVQENVMVDLWDLYAYSRVHEILTLPFQPGTFVDSFLHKYWEGPNISLEKQHEFWLGLGLTPIDSPVFHPFYHEIVEVEQSDDPEERISLVQEIWRGYMLGYMMLCRAGVKVRGGTNHIVKSIAENSVMYWAFWRRNRPYKDLSHGWGHNSQWRTDFRRDYRDNDTFYYNVDATENVLLPFVYKGPNLNRDMLKPEERVELLLNRCFIRTNKVDDRLLWLYDDGYTEQR
ncbi:MAG: hypothetical protein DPW16_14685 [Chloroflexi bacterium]|nr:hypothetical protein [Chloroflexota bacterium]